MTTAIRAERDMRQMWAEAQAETDALFEIVRPEFLYERPIPERHRIVFYIGHLAAFDWNLLRDRLNLKSFDPAFDRLFAFGIDPVEGNLPADQPEDWPVLERVYEYRERVRKALAGGIAEQDFGEVEEGSLSQLMHIAVEHRRMHAETLAYIFHQMPYETKDDGLALRRRGTREGEPRAEAIRIPAGVATLGLDRGSGRFGWDNEFELHRVHLPEFSIDKYKVSNGQFLKFVDDGGYENPEWWSPEGWAWRERDAISHPGFWARQGGEWYWRSMFELVPLPLDWPVYVSHAEASAYAKWAGASLPSEEQWHRAAYGTPDGEEREFPWGDQAPGEPANGIWDPFPVHDAGTGVSAFGVEALLGNGWEWTSTLFGPFPGFRKFPSYPGYSEPFFDGKHYVLKGGSVRTAASMLRRSFRNWFQPHYPYIYAGFRCVRPEAK